MPRDKRVERNAASVTALHAALENALLNPSLPSSNLQFVRCLKSQGKFAQYADQSRGIHASSINTLKRIADQVLPGGFTALDELRKRVIIALAREATPAAPKPKTKAELLRRAEDQERVEVVLREDLELLTFALHRALTQAIAYASRADPTVAALCTREQREILDMLSLRKTPRAVKKAAS